MQTNYQTVKLKILFYVFLAALLFYFDLEAENWLENYRYRQKISVSDGFYVTGSDLKNFPLLLVLADSQNPFFQKTKPDGGDIAFTASDGTTMLPHELEIFSLSPAKLICWVRLPVLFSDRETFMYLYYGSPGPLPGLPAEDVWKEGFVGVWHFQDEEGKGCGTTVIKNSAGKFLLGKTTGSLVEGKIGKAIVSSVSFDPKEKLEFNPETSFTAEAWVYCQEIPFRTTLSVLGKGSGGRGWSLYWHEAGRWQANITQDYRTENTRFYLMSPDNPLEQWRYLTVTYQAEERKMRLFVNGLEKASGKLPDGLKEFSVNQPFFIGGIKGKIDEVRLSSVARSPDWIAACEKNQSSPGRYIRFYQQESLPLKK